MKTPTIPRHPAGCFLAASLCAVFLLSLGGCGGGGGGGSTTSTTPTTFDPPTPPPPVIVRPPPNNPNPANPTPGPPSPANRPATVSAEEFALGERDSWYMPNGGFELANNGFGITQTTKFRYPDGLNLLHRRVKGPRTGDNSLVTRLPPPYIREAWNDGWTGRGVNILTMDSFGIEGLPPSGDQHTHGYLVALAAREVAIGANYFSVNYRVRGSGLQNRQGGYRNMRSDDLVDTATRFHVMNISFGAAPSSEGTVFTATDVHDFWNRHRLALYNDLTGINLPNSGDAVITSSAGNDGVDAGRSLTNFALVHDSHTGPRALIVGALINYATCRPGYICATSLASSSNRPGTDTDMQNRFLVEFGGSPFREDAYLCDRDISTDCANSQLLDTSRIFGTSLAAPRVAGYAALVRHKFPNLTGARTASILLDTATYSGLTSRNPEIHGQGRVDIGRALAPIGAMQ